MGNCSCDNWYKDGQEVVLRGNSNHLWNNSKLLTINEDSNE